MKFYDAQKKPTKVGVDEMANVPLCAKETRDEHSVDDASVSDTSTDNNSMRPEITLVFQITFTLSATYIIFGLFMQARILE